VAPEKLGTKKGENMIKNYTSGVPVDRTVAKIESTLVSGGASNIVKDYKDGTLDAICFMVVMPNTGERLAVRLPANVDAVYETLRSQVKKPRRGTFDKLKEQASRTAWKLMQDWVEIQMSLIQMHQTEFLQVFLPYVWNGKVTFYHQLKEQGFKQLTSGKKENA
jgi:hypothetical protein